VRDAIKQGRGHQNSLFAVSCIANKRPTNLDEHGCCITAGSPLDIRFH